MLGPAAPAGPQGSPLPASARAAAARSCCRTFPASQLRLPAGAAQPTVMTILAAQNIPNDQLEAAAASVSRQLGVGPNDPIDTKDAQVRNVLGPAIQRIKGVGQVVASGCGDSATTGGPQVQPAAPNDRVAQTFNSPQGDELTNAID